MTTLIKGDEYKTGTCEHCGDETAVFEDNDRCERCDGEFYYCSICKQEQHRQDLCRHIFEDRNFEWEGSGTEQTSETVKAAFFRLLGRMPAGFAGDLRKAIRSGRFHTWLCAPLIGGGGLLELHGMPDRDGKSMLFKWGEAMIDIGEGDDAEDTADGYHWLASLYDKKTLKANRATVAWIDEWSALGQPR
jgi:hypothetical protein